MRLFPGHRRIVAVLLLCFTIPLAAQTPNTDTANLKQVNAEGLKKLTQAQFLALSGLQPGSQIGRTEMQQAADRLVATGLFGNVKYDFRTKGADLFVTFHLEENPRVPVFFD